MIKITHGSDWHGKVPDLPPADLYILTGDMLKNYPVFDGAGCSSKIDRRVERRDQGRYIRDNSGRLRDHLGNKDAPVVFVRGNHDFVNLFSWAGGEVYEFGTTPSVFEILGLRIGGFRGVPAINGAWSDELSQEQDSDRALSMQSDIDFLVTHPPPNGVKDTISVSNNYHLGSQGIANWFTRQMYYSDKRRVKAHFFGHIHESFGMEEKKVHEGVEPSMYFSNAATGYINYVWNKNKLIMLSSHRGLR